MIGNDDGGTKHLRNLEGRSFENRGVVWNMARLKNLRSDRGSREAEVGE